MEIIDETRREINEQVTKSLARNLGMEIFDLFTYHDGFSFSVNTELEAYKAAYKYQTLKTVVSYAPGVQMWRIRVYKNK